jgi:hypothetical protein
VLHAARVQERVSKDERLGVLAAGPVAVLDVVRLIEEARCVGSRVSVAANDARLWLPFTPEGDLALLELAALEVAAAAL